MVKLYQRTLHMSIIFVQYVDVHRFVKIFFTNMHNFYRFLMQINETVHFSPGVHPLFHPLDHIHFKTRSSIKCFYMLE